VLHGLLDLIILIILGEHCDGEIFGSASERPDRLCGLWSSVTELYVEGQASTLAHLGLDSRNFLILETCAGGDTSVLYWLQQEAHYC
jgi:hypothetical protein